VYLGIEIGGTKLQLGVGPGDGGPLAILERLAVEPAQRAQGILRQIARSAAPLIREHSIRAVGVGFGGPVDAATGRTVVSHQVEGWRDFPLADWCRQTLGLPALVANDSDSAGLAEARFGAGRGRRIVFYSNVGSGIGGALAIGGQLYQGAAGIASEIGHLRPGLHAERPDQTVEAMASGWGVTEAVQARLSDPVSHSLESLVRGSRPAEPDAVRQRLAELEEAAEQDAADLLQRCDGKVEQLDARIIATAAQHGNRLAREAFHRAIQAFGWALGQVITLLAPDVVVVGGGVSLVGEDLFFRPLRAQVRRYVFPPLCDAFEIIPAALGEEVVVHGVLALAAERFPIASPSPSGRESG
jgi:glucokinase